MIVGTRGSKLALAQTNQVSKALSQISGEEVETEIIKTKGEKEDIKEDIISIQDKALGWFSKPKLHGYLGVQSLSFTDLNVIPYGKVNIEFKKLNVGALLYVSDNPSLKYGLIFLRSLPYF